MAGRTHTTRTPHRMNDVLGRDALGFVARQTVATQDLRKAIYVGPYGKGYHRVRNPFSGEVYVVADGLGGATVEPDSVVMVASFSGAHGEVLVTRPPAGFGGAATSTVTRTPYAEPTGAGVDEGVVAGNAGLRGFCWDANNSRAIIARTREVTDPATYYLEFVSVERASIPHLNSIDGTILTSIEISSAESTALNVYAMQTGNFSSFYVFYYIGEAGSVADTALMHLVRISASGSIAAHITYDFPDVATLGSVGTAFLDNHLYAIEYINSATESTGGLPIENNQRITKRNETTLAVVDEYDVPDPGSYDGWTLSGSAVRTIINNSGALRAFFEYQQSGTGDYKFFYQDFDSTLGLSGVAVAMDGNPYSSAPSIGVSNNVQINPGGGIRFVQDGSLYSATVTGATRTLVLAGYNADGNSFFGIAEISTTETLILGTGSAFSTSILTSTGQQFP